MADKFDIIVVGGGLVGLLAAAELGKRFKLAIIDKDLASNSKEGKNSSGQKSPNPNNPNNPAKPFDMRVIAVNNSSMELLRSNAIEPQRKCPFINVEVWEEGVKPLKFSSSSAKEEQLGWIIENNEITVPLKQNIHAADKISCYASAVTYFNPQNNTIKTSDGKELQADLIIAADGRESFIRSKLPMEVFTIGHETVAMVAHVETDYAQSDTTWQRFTPEGPQAFLPLAGNNASLVWYVSPEYASYLLGLKENNGKDKGKSTDDAVAIFTQHLKQAFPSRLGDVSVIKWAGFPTFSQHVSKYYYDGVLLIGDTAHSVHPLAGQGANLGFSDVQVLAELLEDKNSLHAETYEKYQKRRKPMNMMAIALLEIIYRGFGNAIPEIQMVRQAALKAAGLPFINNLLIRGASGKPIMEELSA